MNCLKALFTLALIFHLPAADGRTQPRTTAGGTPPSAAAATRKRALLVGVSDYCRDPLRDRCTAGAKFWWDLHAERDVLDIREALREKFGFADTEIKILKTRAETTHANIVRTFRTFLVAGTRPGDIVFFHFSGHGSQVPDDRSHGPNLKVGDEFDGLDETLVPSDYVAQDDKSNDIRDDEIEALLAQLSGRHVVMTVDSCFSGTITRGGDSLMRGLKWAGRLPTQREGVAADGPSGIFTSGAGAPRNTTVITAARSDQKANEFRNPSTGSRMGMLSYALVKALTAAGRETTYRDLFERISGEVTRTHRDQDPQLEGPRDLVLFSGLARPPQPYIGVTTNGDTVLLKAGALHAVTAGSRFAVYPPGADPKGGSPIAQGEVVAVGPTSSVLRLTPAPTRETLEELRAARAVETEHNYGDVRLKVLVEDGARGQLGADALEQLQVHRLLNTRADASDWNVRICSDRCADEKLPEREGPITFADGLTLMREDGSVLARVLHSPAAVASIERALEAEARWRFLKGLSNESQPGLRVKLRLVPVTDIQFVKVDERRSRAVAARDLAAEVSPNPGGQLELRDGDLVMLEVMNAGTKDVYVTVLDLRSNGVIAPLWPHPTVPESAGENRIPAKRDARGNPIWHRIPFPFVFKIGEPYGREVFKVFATEQPSDFSLLFTAEEDGVRRGGGVRGATDVDIPLGQLLLAGTAAAAVGFPVVTLAIGSTA